MAITNTAKIKLESKSALKALVVMSLACVFLFSTNAYAGNNNCKNIHYAAQDSDQMQVVTYAEPDLPAILAEDIKANRKKSTISWYSWLTKSHTMPSLHFIDFIELFGQQDEQ